MAVHKLLKFFFIVALFCSCKETRIVGNWTRTNLKLPDELEVKNNGTVGNLELSMDSTFIKRGFEPKDTSSIAEWYVGDNIIGKWTMQNKFLLLKVKVESIESRLTYRIIRLTKHRLIIKFYKSGEFKNIYAKEKYKK